MRHVGMVAGRLRQKASRAGAEGTDMKMQNASSSPGPSTFAGPTVDRMEDRKCKMQNSESVKSPKSVVQFLCSRLAQHQKGRRLISVDFHLISPGFSQFHLVSPSFSSRPQGEPAMQPTMFPVKMAKMLSAIPSATGRAAAEAAAAGTSFAARENEKTLLKFAGRCQTLPPL